MRRRPPLGGKRPCAGSAARRWSDLLRDKFDRKPPIAESEAEETSLRTKRTIRTERNKDWELARDMSFGIGDARRRFRYDWLGKSIARKSGRNGGHPAAA